MPILGTPFNRVRIATAPDIADPDVTSPEVHSPGQNDYAIFNIQVETAATATVQIRVYDRATGLWYDADDGAVSFTAVGAKQLRIINPGGPIWPRLTALDVGGGTVTISLCLQRQMR
jgi:hypothetical protein